MIQRKVFNIIGLGLIVLFAILAMVPLLSVFYTVLDQGLSSVNLEFLTSLPAPVGEVGGGIGHAILGSLVLITMAMLISLPVGFGIGILLAEFPKTRFNRLLSSSVELLSSIPSIVVGLFAYTILVKPFKGFSAHAGALALSMVMIPSLAKTTEEMLKLVPQHVREAGLALGLTRTQVILRIVVSGSLGPLMVGVILSVARIAGETAPLLFTAFASQQWMQGLSQPIASIPVQIYNYAISPYEDWHHKAWGGALILMTLVMSLNLLIRFTLHRRNRS